MARDYDGSSDGIGADNPCSSLNNHDSLVAGLTTQTTRVDVRALSQTISATVFQTG